MRCGYSKMVKLSYGLRPLACANDIVSANRDVGNGHMTVYENAF